MVKMKDPICGMTVDSDRAPAQGVYGGQSVYFCSAGCKTAYEAQKGFGKGPPAGHR
jgi:P-type Cu+ transporter